MGLLGGMMGNASEMNLQEVQKEYQHILATSEKIEKAYKLIRDLFIFTNKRLILIDRQGITGRKMDVHSFPYKSITHFRIETAGTFDLDAELKFWVSGSALPISRKFNKSLNIYELQSVLAEYIMK